MSSKLIKRKGGNFQPYSSGLYWCSECQEWKKNTFVKCPVCNTVLRKKPRQSKYKERLTKEVTMMASRQHYVQVVTLDNQPKAAANDKTKSLQASKFIMLEEAKTKI